jgi:hypothetical protein
MESNVALSEWPPGVRHAAAEFTAQFCCPVKKGQILVRSVCWRLSKHYVFRGPKNLKQATATARSHTAEGSGRVADSRVGARNVHADYCFGDFLRSAQTSTRIH